MAPTNDISYRVNAPDLHRPAAIPADLQARMPTTWLHDVGMGEVPLTHFDVRWTTPFLVIQAYRALRHAMSADRWESGVYEGRDLVILELARRGGSATQAELCRALDVGTAAMTTILMRTSAALFVERKRSEKDRRTWDVALTPLARREAKMMVLTWKDLEVALRHGPHRLDREAHESLDRGLRSMTQTLGTFLEGRIF